MMANLATAFSRRDVKVDIVLVKKTGPYLDELPSSVRVIELGTKRTLASLPGLMKYLRKYRPDVLLSALDNANTVAVMAKRLTRTSTRIVVSAHANLPSPESPKLYHTKLGRFLANRTYGQADCVVAVSDLTATTVAEWAGITKDRIKVIYNPIVYDDMLLMGQSDPGHPWLPVDSMPVILGVGRLTQVKRFDTLIEAFNVLRETMRARLIILGDGPLRNQLQNLASTSPFRNDIDIYGRVDNPFAFMANANVVVLPSESESFGNVLVEAMAMGTSIVSTACGGPEEILENGRYGALVPIGDAKKMSEAIMSVIKCPTPKGDLVERSREFEVGRISDKYYAVLSPEGKTSSMKN